MPNQCPSFASISPPSGAARPAPPPQFSLTRRAEGGTIRLILAGELDLAGRDDLAQALADAQSDAADIVLDLGALSFIDVPCFGIVCEAASRARRDGGLLILLEPRSQVRRVLDLVGAPDGVLVLDRSDAVVANRFEAAA